MLTKVEYFDLLLSRLFTLVKWGPTLENVQVICLKTRCSFIVQPEAEVTIGYTKRAAKSTSVNNMN